MCTIFSVFKTMKKLSSFTPESNLQSALELRAQIHSHPQETGTQAHIVAGDFFDRMGAALKPG